jgi:hypothetical protein
MTSAPTHRRRSPLPHHRPYQSNSTHVPEELEVAWRLTSKELRGKRREFGGERSARGGGPLRDGRAFDEPSLSHASVEV